MLLILPGVVAGALFAFDEVVAVIFPADYEQRTILCQMWAGIREQISTTILAMASILIVLSIALLTIVELLRRRSECLRGMTLRKKASRCPVAHSSRQRREHCCNAG